MIVIASAPLNEGSMEIAFTNWEKERDGVTPAIEVNACR